MKEPVHRWVIKVGSSLVTRGGQGVDQAAIDHWSDQIAALRREMVDHHASSASHDGGEAARILPEIILVSSGAIAEGVKRLGWARRPREVAELQAAAAIGQMGIVQAYESSFRRHGIVTAQVLLTHEDLADRRRYLNARSMLNRLLALGVVPIINENDSVITDEIKVGDNDTLGALVGNLAEAEWLVILTDQAGLYTADPRKDPSAALLPEVQAGDPALERMAGGAGSSVGTGGMLTKVLAAKRAARSGTSTIVCSGHEPDVLLRLMAGESIGTRFIAQTQRLAARKKWMADHLQVRGRVLVDAGAARALRSGGRSLLPVGVVGVEGDFGRGELVSVWEQGGAEIARGLVNYAATDARRISRQPSSRIEAILGFIEESELIHRDNLVLR
ncbi:MAG: glutamate 5-kinase [Lautropia sp.]|nr:glutamate 5-kinase [Lautropia sp.]